MDTVLTDEGGASKYRNNTIKFIPHITAIGVDVRQMIHDFNKRKCAHLEENQRWN